ncbi:MAG: Flp pilus assembly protein CpaB [Alphaproteobacteria bacterium]|nr:Flp pilus assembly protein CpaB [Alphaproteobacteria bacterium]
MRPITAILIIIVVICTGFFAIFAKQLAVSKREMVLGKDGEVVKAKEMVDVLVANLDLTAGTEISSHSVKWTQWPKENINVDLITGDDKTIVDEIIGMVVRRGFMKNEPIMHNRLFKREDGGFMAGMLTPGMRAVGVKIDIKDWGTGFILPGDRVDIILVNRVNKPTSDDADAEDQEHVVYKNASETILNNVRVLAVDQDIADVGASSKIVKTVTLEVTPKQVEKLALAKEVGEVSLALRSLGEKDNAQQDYNDSFTSDIDMSSAINAVLNGGEALSSSSSSKRVKIYRGSKVSTQTVKGTAGQ